MARCRPAGTRNSSNHQSGGRRPGAGQPSNAQLLRNQCHSRNILNHFQCQSNKNAANVLVQNISVQNSDNTLSEATANPPPENLVNSMNDQSEHLSSVIIALEEKQSESLKSICKL